VGGVALLHSSVSFDMAVTTLYGPLLTGGAVRLVELRDVPASAERPTFLKITPSHLGLLHALPASCAPTSQLVIGGELLTGAATDAWRARFPGVTVINEYGRPRPPSAAPCTSSNRRTGSTPGRCRSAWPRRARGCTSWTRRCGRCPRGRRRAVHLGPQVARGYLGRPGLTAAKFLPDPSGDEPGGRMYRTGDLARRRADGVLEFFGRTDDQVKIRGYRIELGEIESAVSRLPDVLAAAVVARETGAGTSSWWPTWSRWTAPRRRWRSCGPGWPARCRSIWCRPRSCWWTRFR